jgi:hypothetical protein
MTCVLLVFAGSVFWMTGSASSVLVATVVAAIVLQVGYFLGVLYLVHREKLQREAARGEQAPTLGDRRSNDQLPADAAAHWKIPDH